MSIWAIIRAGSAVVRHCDGHPAENGHADECEGAIVHSIAAEPRWHLGETIDPETGAVLFDFDLAREGVFTAIKRAAGERILQAVPLWRQINDVGDDSDAARERREVVGAWRAWSNAIEAEAAGMETADALQALLQREAIGM